MIKKEHRDLVNECRASGMSAKTWCESQGIQYRRYLTWATQLNKESVNEPQKWANVTLLQEKSPVNEIKLNCGKWTICVEPGFSPSLLGDVLKVVNSAC